MKLTNINLSLRDDHILSSFEYNMDGFQRERERERERERDRETERHREKQRERI